MDGHCPVIDEVGHEHARHPDREFEPGGDLDQGHRRLDEIDEPCGFPAIGADEFVGPVTRLDLGFETDVGLGAGPSAGDGVRPDEPTRLVTLVVFDVVELDVEGVIDVISKGAAGSWQMENRHKTMNAGKYDHGFAVDWMRKDLGICLEEANRNGAALPVTALVDQFYKDVQAMGGNRWDTSSLLARLER